MDAQALIIWLIVGAIAGWLAGMVVKGGGYGLIGDILGLRGRRLPKERDAAQFPFQFGRSAMTPHSAPAAPVAPGHPI